MKSLVLALASTTIALLVGIEVTAYLTVWPPAMSAVGDGTVVYDPEIGLVARPSARTRHIYPAIADRAAFEFDIYTDDRGARVDGAGQRSAARYDILTVGDSFTWAYALANQDSYAARLGRELGAGVANFALASYGTTQSLQILGRTLDLKPRLVVYGIIAHHFERNVWPCAPSYYEFCLDVSHVSWDDAGKPYIAPPFSSGVRRLQVRQSGDYRSPERWLAHGADVIFGRLYHAWSRYREPDDEKKAEAMQFLLQRMNQAVAASGSGLLVVFLPTNYYGPPTALAGIIDRVGGGIRYLDLTGAFERNRQEGGPNPYIVGDGHPGVAGHALIAAEIAKYVRREGLLGPDGATGAPQRSR
ncbi:MAG: hypothetical protein GEV13_14735 [Rhodospirillales bacterium]|nr:hypothetical protein [Rhodospirillales bacterium]